MSRFFAQGNIDSDEQQDKKDEKKKAEPVYSYDFVEKPSQTKKTTVLTPKQKRQALFENFANKTNIALKNLDYDQAWQNLQHLLKEIEKNAQIVEKQGYPGFFIKLLVRIKNQIGVITSEQKKKMKKNQVNAYKNMQNKMKNKYLPLYEKDIENYKQDQIQEESSSEQQSISSEKESQEDQSERALLNSSDPAERRKFFLKKKPDEKKNKELDYRKQSRDNDLNDDQQERNKKRNNKKKFNLVELSAEKKIQIASVKDAQNKIKELQRDFAKLTTHQQREQYISNLNQIAKKSGEYKDFNLLSILLADIPIRIQVAKQRNLTHFDRHDWCMMFQNTKKIYHILKTSEDEELLEKITQFQDNLLNDKIKATEQSIYIFIKSFLLIFQSEIKKFFMFIDNNENQYLERLQDFISLIDFIYQISEELNFKGQNKHAAELSFKVLQNMHFMSQSLLQKIQSDCTFNLNFTKLKDMKKFLNYTQFILQNTDQSYRVKTVLFLAYNHTVNERDKGKELLLQSSVPEIIHTCDYYTQTLFNRVIVQIGINAFRHGSLHEVQQYLSELCGISRNKDQSKDVIRQFLSQGYSRSVAAKDIPRNKILPYYMHLNIDLIEALELIASMMIEMPYTLMQGGRITSKTYKRVYYEYQRSHFIAQPLNNHDLIYAASNQLKQGKWQQCYERILQLPIWTQMSNFQLTQYNLKRLIKQQALKCYLIGNRKCFRSISIQGLGSKFELEQSMVQRLICRWVYDKDIEGTINDRRYLVLIHRKQSEMDKMCQSLHEKLEEVLQTEQLMYQQQKINSLNEDEEENEKENKLQKKCNLAMNEKLIAILSKRS